jgi:hypothetical protein
MDNDWRLSLLWQITTPVWQAANVRATPPDRQIMSRSGPTIGLGKSVDWIGYWQRHRNGQI